MTNDRKGGRGSHIALVAAGVALALGAGYGLLGAYKNALLQLEKEGALKGGAFSDPAQILHREHVGYWAAGLIVLIIALRVALFFGVRRTIADATARSRPPEFLALIEGWWEPCSKWIVSFLILGFVAFFYASAKEKHAQEQEANVKRQDTMRSTTDALSQFRSALVEFGSDCLPRSSAVDRRRSLRLVDPTCADTYRRVIDGWTRATWLLPRFISEIQGKECDGAKYAGSCELLKGKGALGLSAVSYRRFVKAYARSRGARTTELSELLKATQALFETTRKLGCALLFANVKIGEPELPTCYCTQVVLEAAHQGNGKAMTDDCRQSKNGMHPDGSEVDQLRFDDPTGELETWSPSP